MRRRLRRGLPRAAAVIAGLAIAVAVLAGCGDGEDDPAPATAPANFFGVVSQTPLAEQELTRMGQGKVGSLRVHLPWANIDPEPKAGDFDWGATDGVILAAAARGIEPQPFLFGTPRWVATDMDGEDACDPNCAIYAPRSPEALEAWGKFVGAAVERYGPEGKLWEENPDVDPVPVRAWQIWNEQNSPSFYQPKPDVEEYATMLKVAAEAIRKEDPEAQIVLGGMFGTPLGGERPAYAAYDYLKRLYEDGADEYFDGVGVHPYGAHAQKIESQVDLMRDEVERAGDTDATTWITELGWASSGPDHPLNKGPQGQAEELTAAFDMLLEHRLEWNVEGVTWYAWRDLPEEGTCAWCAGAGLFEAEELEPKPAWDAFTAFTGGT
jgi:polysaccharide biosynthesis protein PslG